MSGDPRELREIALVMDDLAHTAKRSVINITSVGIERMNDAARELRAFAKFRESSIATALADWAQARSAYGAHDCKDANHVRFHKWQAAEHALLAALAEQETP